MVNNIILAPQSHSALIYINGSLLTNIETRNAIRTPIELIFQDGYHEVLLKDDQGIYEDITIKLSVSPLHVTYETVTDINNNTRSNSIRSNSIISNSIISNSINLPIYYDKSLDTQTLDTKPLQEHVPSINTVEGAFILSFAASLLASYVAYKQFKR